MPYTYTIEDRIVHIAWAGVVSKEDLQSIGKDMPRLAGLLGFPPDVLHTFEGMTGYSFQPIAAYVLSLIRKRVTIPHPVRSASVVTTPEMRKIARFFRSINRTENLEMELFETEEAARRWLGQKNRDRA